MVAELLWRAESDLSILDVDTSGSIPNRVLLEARAFSQGMAMLVGNYISVQPSLASILGFNSLPDELGSSLAAAANDRSLWTLYVDSQLSSLHYNYTLQNPDAIKEFLFPGNRRLVSVLQEAAALIKEFFGQDATIELELVNDPEADSQQLFGYIHAPSLSVQESLDQLSKFDDAWFLRQYELTDGLLNFNLE